MTEKELKKYALCGLLNRIDTEKTILNKTTDERHRQQASQKIEYLINQYNGLVDELRKENPL